MTGIIGFVAVLFFSGVLWYCLHNRVVTRYYANMVHRNSVPLGYFELSPQMRSHRGIRYRFDFQYGRVILARRENILGRLINDTETHNASQWKPLYLQGNQ